MFSPSCVPHRARVMCFFNSIPVGDAVDVLASFMVSPRIPVQSPAAGKFSFTAAGMARAWRYRGMPTPLQRLAHVFVFVLLASCPSAPAIDAYGYYQSEHEFGEQRVDEE